MSERPKPTPTVDLVTEALTNITVDNYLDKVANPLVLKYIDLEWTDDPEINSRLTSLSAHPLEIQDINNTYIYHLPMALMLVGAHMVEQDIKPGVLTEEKLTKRTRDAYGLFSALAWMEITRRRHQGAINPAALFRATNDIFYDKLGSIFEERPLKEKLELFNAGYQYAFGVIHNIQAPSDVVQASSG